MPNPPKASTLTGGANPIQPVLLNDTVRRPLHPRASYVHAVLQRLEAAKIDWAPRFLGLDEVGREIITYIPGEVWHHHTKWNDAQLRIVVRMMRQFHDATARATLAGEAEVVCHNDIAPWNTVMRDSVPVAFIDFNEAAPGKRIDDLAYALWVFLGLGAEGVSAMEQARRVRLLCEEYGPLDLSHLTDAILRQQERVLVMRENQAQCADCDETRQWAQGRVREIQNAMRWVKAYNRW